MAATAYEQEREARIAANRKKMEELGLMKAASIVDSFRAVKKPPAAKPKLNYVQKARAHAVQRARLDPRRSGRLSGSEVTSVEIDERDRPVPSQRVDAGTSTSRPTEVAMLEDPEALVDLMENARHVSVPENASQEVWDAMQAVRCNSKGRGTLYDKAIGITCHFCRQKKLCGEENCPRCSNRDASKECIGKTNCTRCGGATGQFCRSCLDLRYGQDLDQAKAQQAAGEWLCPHCYEEDHPDEGWICNSSICMTRRGLKPTGIAIYDARKLGFKSVAHLLQDRIRTRKGGVNGEDDASEDGNTSSQGGSQGNAASQQLNNGAGTSNAAAKTTAVTTGDAQATQQQGADNKNNAAVEAEEEGATLGSRLRKLRTAAGAAATEQQQAPAPPAGQAGEGAEKEKAAGKQAAARGQRRTRAAAEEAAGEQEVASPANKRRSTRLAA